MTKLALLGIAFVAGLVITWFLSAKSPSSTKPMLAGEIGGVGAAGGDDGGDGAGDGGDWAQEVPESTVHDDAEDLQADVSAPVAVNIPVAPEPPAAGGHSPQSGPDAPEPVHAGATLKGEGPDETSGTGSDQAGGSGYSDLYVEAAYGPGSAAPAADGSGPRGWMVKGDQESMRYHTDASPHYAGARADVWFRDEATAEAAGFARWDSTS